MCGSEDQLYRVKIEDTLLNVCKSCSGFGKVINPIQPPQKPTAEVTVQPVRKEKILAVVGDCASLIREKRESLGLNQDDFAKKLNEKVSVIHNIETARFRPSIDLARKFESMLRINLIEQIEEGDEKIEATKSNSFTIGDFIKVK